MAGVMEQSDGPKRGNLKRLPRFRSIEEEAEFWDTHDSTEFDWRDRKSVV